MPHLIRKVGGVLLRLGRRLQARSAGGGDRNIPHILDLSGISDIVCLEDVEESACEIPSMTSPGEARTLFMLSALGPGGGDIVEIGSWLGFSTVYLANGCRLRGEGVVHAIDHFQGNPGKETIYHSGLREGETILSRFRDNISKAGVQDLVEVHAADSESARREINGPVRMLFVDGCHDYEAVKRDVALYEDLVVPGGLVACHDFSPAFPGNVRAVRECLVDSGGYEKFLLTDRLFVARKK